MGSSAGGFPRILPWSPLCAGVPRGEAPGFLFRSLAPRRSKGIRQFSYSFIRFSILSDVFIVLLVFLFFHMFSYAFLSVHIYFLWFPMLVLCFHGAAYGEIWRQRFIRSCLVSEFLTVACYMESSGQCANQRRWQCHANRLFPITPCGNCQWFQWAPEPKLRALATT